MTDTHYSGILLQPAGRNVATVSSNQPQSYRTTPKREIIKMLNEADITDNYEHEKVLPYNL